MPTRENIPLLASAKRSGVAGRSEAMAGQALKKSDEKNIPRSSAYSAGNYFMTLWMTSP